MNEAEARKILGQKVQPDGSLYSLVPYVRWEHGDGEVVLDGDFSGSELRALAFWLTNKGL